MIYGWDAYGSLVVAWLLGFAIAYDRKHIRRAWKPVLVLLTIEQAVLAYGSLEASHSHIKIEARQVLFGIVILSLILSVIFVLSTIRRPSNWWYYRDENGPETSDLGDPPTSHRQ